MADSDTSENEPLIVSHSQHVDDIEESRIHLNHVPRDFKSLEIVAIYAVAFDTHKGNIVEWSKPEFIREQISGLEFKALPSGAHKVDSDFVYLFEAELYGVASYSKLSLDSEVERGARMKSIGILSHSYQMLHYHQKKLAHLVRLLLEKPGDYSKLDEYYSQWTGDFLAKHSNPLADNQVSLPDKYLSKFVMKFGLKVFLIWKAILLQKRILFYGEPPASQLCQDVYAASLLATQLHKLRNNLCRPFFYINITDCQTLSQQTSYIACTTEKVFEGKTDLYDVYFDQTNVITVDHQLIKALLPTSSDQNRLAQLHRLLRSPITSYNDNPMTAEDVVYSYFGSLNSSIADKLHQMEQSDEMSMSWRDMKHLGFDKSDSHFLRELLDSMNLDISYTATLCSCLC